MQTGYDLEITRMISESVPVPVVASGGAWELRHFTAVLDQGKADAVLAASVFPLRPVHHRTSQRLSWPGNKSRSDFNF